MFRYRQWIDFWVQVFGWPIIFVLFAWVVAQSVNQDYIQTILNPLNLIVLVAYLFYLIYYARRIHSGISAKK